MVFIGIYRKYLYLVYVFGFRMIFIILNKLIFFWIKLYKVFGKLILYFESNLKYLFIDIIFCFVLERIFNSIYDNIKELIWYCVDKLKIVIV